MIILGVDYGTKRIGTALMDSRVNFPYPHECIHHTSKSQAIDGLLAVISREKAERVVFGLPLHADGTDNDLCRSIRSLAQIITRESGVTADFIDERLTSVDAERMLRGKSPKKRKANVDNLAAVLILEEYARKQ